MLRLSVRIRSLLIKTAACGFALAGLLLILSQSGYAQALPGSLDDGFHHMYNLDFAGAHKIFEAWENLHPGDPLGAASNAAVYLFGELDRLHILEFDIFEDNRKLENVDKSVDPAVKLAFEGELAKSDEIVEKILAASADDTNALLAKMLSDGLKADLAGLVEKRKVAALEFLKSSRVTAEKLIGIDPAYGDAYLAIGIENYVLGIRSAPSRWVLRLTGAQTNKEKGIENLKITADKGRYLSPYARLLLAIASLRDQDRNTARKLLAELVREFPQNRRYQIELAHLHS